MTRSLFVAKSVKYFAPLICNVCLVVGILANIRSLWFMMSISGGILGTGLFIGIFDSWNWDREWAKKPIYYKQHKFIEILLGVFLVILGGYTLTLSQPAAGVEFLNVPVEIHHFLAGFHAGASLTVVTWLTLEIPS